MLFNYLAYAVISHDLGKTSHLSLLFVLLSVEYFACVKTCHHPAPGGDIWCGVVQVEILNHVFEVVIITRVI